MNKLLAEVYKAIDEKKGEDIISYEFTPLNPFIDYVIICSAQSLRQVHAIANNIQERMKEKKFLIKRKEGNKESRWILIDLDSVIVHIFYDEERHIYQLEKLYADLKQVDLSV